jgi:hypothetical protein
VFALEAGAASSHARAAPNHTCASGIDGRVSPAAAKCARKIADTMDKRQIRGIVQA